MIRRPPRSTHNSSSAASDVYKRQLLTGEYDYSATPEETKSLADTIGIEMIKMKNVGHFPMSENPKEFLKYLHPVLNKIS